MCIRDRSETVSYVNAPLLAEQRGIDVRLIVDSDSPEYRNVITLAGALADGRQITVSGTLTGTKQIEKLVGVNGYEIEVPIATTHIVMQYTDRPGIVAIYGREFGEAGINIAGMQIARREAGGQALSVLTVDSPVPSDVLDRVREAIEADVLVEIDITEELRAAGAAGNRRGHAAAPMPCRASSRPLSPSAAPPRVARASSRARPSRARAARRRPSRRRRRAAPSRSRDRRRSA